MNISSIQLLPYFNTCLFSFPNTQVTRLLLHYGHQWINLDAVDRVRGDTALHRIASSLTGINAIEIIELLINSGAHTDCVNNYGETPVDAAVVAEIRTLLQSIHRPPRLKCLCACLIVDQQLNYDSVWPVGTALNQFVVLHGDLSRKHIVSDECSSVDSLYYFSDD